MTDVDHVCHAETAGGTGSVVCSANLTFFMFFSASQTERVILSCASLTRTLRATSEDMALMIRVLHYSVTGAVDNAEAGPLVEEECLVQKLAYESGQISYDEATTLPLDPKMVVDVHA